MTKRIENRVVLLVGSLFTGALLAASVALGGIAGGDGNAVADQFAGLAAPRGVADVLPSRIQRGIDAMNAAPAPVSEAMFEGEHEKSKSQLLLAGAGSGGLDIYGYPTSKGRVCFTTSRGGGGCVSRSDPFAWGAFVPRDLTLGVTVQYVGVVPNSVRGVTVVDGDERPAVMGANAFFYELAYDGTLPTALVLEYRNGKTETVGLPDLSR